MCIALIIFGVALLRINKTVAGIEEAYPNKGVAVLHFILVISILFFNVSVMFDAFMEYRYMENK